MVDLGPYALPVLAAYAVTLGLLAALIGVSLWRYRAVRRALAALQKTEGKDNAQA